MNPKSALRVISLETLSRIQELWGITFVTTSAARSLQFGYVIVRSLDTNKNAEAKEVEVLSSYCHLAAR